MTKIYSITIVLLITVSVFLTQQASAQAPQKMSYQAVIRNSANALISSAPVGMKISVLKGFSTGVPVYVETQSTTTNANGLVSLQIGTGTVVTGTFAGINWANGPYFIKTETDPKGGSSYTISGTSELISVPYALYSANGVPGPAGPIGIAGPQGLTGPSGPTGNDGPTGDIGAKGATGATALIGPSWFYVGAYRKNIPNSNYAEYSYITYLGFDKVMLTLIVPYTDYNKNGVQDENEVPRTIIYYGTVVANVVTFKSQQIGYGGNTIELIGTYVGKILTLTENGAVLLSLVKEP